MLLETNPADPTPVMFVALGLAVAAFIVYVVETVVAARNKPVADATKVVQSAAAATQVVADRLAASAAVPAQGVARAADAAPAPSFVPATLGELTDMIKALPAMIDSLVKGGPSLTSLIGAVLFLMIGALSAGVFQSPKPAPTTTQTPKPTDVPSTKTSSGEQKFCLVLAPAANCKTPVSDAPPAHPASP
jgi:hypothetical protein